jgi:DNA-binding response OmpR family regulator
MSTKVLMVEDHADTSQVVALLLGVEGIAVITAQDGYEGINKAETERPNLIIADLEMPRLGGIEMIKRLRQHQELSNVPILVFTAHGEKLASRAIEAGADGVLCKTSNFDALVGAVKGMLYSSSH